MRSHAVIAISFTFFVTGAAFAFDPDSLMNHVSYQDPSLAMSVLCQQYPDSGTPDCMLGFSFDGQSGTVPFGPTSLGYGRPRPSVLEITDNAGRFDAVGNQYVIGYITNPYRTGVLRVAPNGAVTALLWFDLTAYPPQTTYEPSLTGLHVDPVNGILLLSAIYPYQFTYAGCSCPVPDTWLADREMIEVSGLPTLFDVMASFDPNGAALSIAVPRHPFGLRSADKMSVFVGDAAGVSDFSKATPLTCDVTPGRAPLPGERVSVPDTAPPLPPGAGRFYLVTADRLGQRRAGRSSNGGTLQARDVSGLQGCP